MKVLVTGGTGFIGSRLIERLRQRGDEVRCVAKDRMNASFLESLNVEIVLGDMNNGIDWDTLLDGVECIYHLAGVTRARSWREYYEGNHLATKRLIDVCTRSRVDLKRFLYVSSLAAAGPSCDGHEVRETSPMHPVSHYGRSKMLGELEVVKACDRFPITIVRPSAVYGPRERDVYQYMKLIQRGIQPLIGFGKKFLNMIYSDDLVEGILLAASHPRAAGETYFLGSETNYSTEDFGNAIALAVGRNPLRFHIPHSLAYVVGAIAELTGRIARKQVFFNLQKAKESVQQAWICSTEKARTHIGFREQVTLEIGMVRTYRWYRQQGWL